MLDLSLDSVRVVFVLGGTHMFSEFKFSASKSLIAVGVASGAINILNLTGSLFMLEVYDRVLPSKSIPSLLALCFLTLILFAFQALFDIVRGRIMIRTANLMEEQLSSRVYEAVVRAPLVKSLRGDPTQPITDLDNVRTFLSGQGLSAFFDFPWLPVYLFICFLLHPLIGLTVLVGAIILIILAALTEWSTARLNQNASTLRGRRNNFVSSSLRSAEAAKAMGMVQTMSAMWREHQGALRSETSRSADMIGGFAASSRTIRMVLQSGVMAVGAYLVVMGETTAGSIIAGSILSAKALAPVELGITNWRSFASARNSWARLQAFLTSFPDPIVETTLPQPCRELSLENVTGGPPGGRVTVSDVSFSLEAGDALGIVGPSGSGKSTLARMIVGIWQSLHGSVRFDGASIEQWRPQDIGKSIGYLPQSIELFPGTISQNIARFDPNATSTSVVSAAREAGVHELIVTLPQGYDTRIGDGGEALSMGQTQRVALARALYGDPFVVLLDEPNSNLDRDGDIALSAAIASVRARKGIVIVIAHRPSALENVNKVMVMAFGRLQHFGHRDEFLRPNGSNVHPISGGPASKEIANAAD